MMRQGIFVVDDQADIRECLVDALEGEGYPVQAFASGPQAWAALSGGARPTCILLDLTLTPEMTGQQLLAKLRQAPRLGSVPVVLMSANTVERPLITSMGAAEFLEKPFDLSTLLRTVQTLWSRAA